MPKLPKLSPSKVDPLVHLGEEALRILEQRGYEVRGKTAEEIKEIIKRPPTNPKANA